MPKWPVVHRGATRNPANGAGSGRHDVVLAGIKVFKRRRPKQVTMNIENTTPRRRSKPINRRNAKDNDNKMNGNERTRATTRQRPKMAARDEAHKNAQAKRGSHVVEAVVAVVVNVVARSWTDRRCPRALQPAHLGVPTHAEGLHSGPLLRQPRRLPQQRWRGEWRLVIEIGCGDCPGCVV